MTYRTPVSSAFDSFLRASPVAQTDHLSRMHSAAKQHALTANFRDNTPELTGQTSDHDVHIRHRFEMYSRS